MRLFLISLLLVAVSQVSVAATVRFHFFSRPMKNSPNGLAIHTGVIVEAVDHSPINLQSPWLSASNSRATMLLIQVDNGESDTEMSFEMLGFPSYQKAKEEAQARTTKFSVCYEPTVSGVTLMDVVEWTNGWAKNKFYGFSGRAISSWLQSLSQSTCSRDYANCQNYVVDLARNYEQKGVRPSSANCASYLSRVAYRKRAGVAGVSNTTAPPGWSCDPANYGALDGCDCACGIADPDCAFNASVVYHCPNGGSPYCTQNNSCAYRQVPGSWICDAAFYNSSDGCDCSCGAGDPDCVRPGPVLGCGDGVGISCSSSGLCLRPFPIPVSWTCDEAFYNATDGCDCNCGAPDPDCAVQGQLFNCPCSNMTCSGNGNCVGDCNGVLIRESAGASLSVGFVASTATAVALGVVVVVLLVVLFVAVRVLRRGSGSTYSSM